MLDRVKQRLASGVGLASRQGSRGALAAAFLAAIAMAGCQPAEVHSIPDDGSVGGKTKAEDGQGRFQPPAKSSSAPAAAKPGAPAGDEGIQSR